MSLSLINRFIKVAARLTVTFTFSPQSVKTKLKQKTNRYITLTDDELRPLYRILNEVTEVFAC